MLYCPLCEHYFVANGGVRFVTLYRRGFPAVRVCPDCFNREGGFDGLAC